MNYTYSVLKDNQIGEDQLLLRRSARELAVNNYNFLVVHAGVHDGQTFTTACYDPSSRVQLRHRSMCRTA